MNVVVKMEFGSKLYGTDTPESDTDYKGICLPTKQQVLLGNTKFIVNEDTNKSNTKNSAEDIDQEFHSLQNFINLAVKGETFALDMLHAPKDKILESSPIWDLLVANRSKLYTKNMSAYVGYVRKQAAKYSVKGSRLAVLEDALSLAKNLPEQVSVFNEATNGFIDVDTKVCHFIEQLPLNEYAELFEMNNEKTGLQKFYMICGRKFQDTLKLSVFIDSLQKVYDGYGERAKAARDNKGIDWKAIHHALRAGYQVKSIFENGTFSYPLPETEFLMDVKLGKLDWVTEVQSILEDLVDEVFALSEESEFPEEVDREFWDNLIMSTHLGIVR